MSSLATKSHEIVPDTFNPSPSFIQRGYVLQDRFTIDGVIGSGGQAKVYAAKDDVTGLDVAVKIPKITNEFELCNAVREAEVTEGLSHASTDVVPFVDADIVSDGRHPFMYIATERMSDGNLGGKIYKAARTTGHVAIDELVEIMRPAAHAASITHDAGLVHRDIKAGNIFVDEFGCGKLGDYGIVGVETLEPAKLDKYHISPEALEEVTLSYTIGTLVGTAPELLDGQHGYSKASDVFAFGTTLHHGLTGKALIEPVSSVQELKMIMKDFTPPEISAYDNRVPSELAMLAIKCLDPNPANRATMQEAATTLSRVEI